MRLPWVSREAYEEVRELYRHYLGLVDADSARYADLLSKYHALRMNGANPVAEPRIVEPQEPDAVMWAINQRAGSNHALRLYLTNWAAKEALGGSDTGSIIERIEKWSNESDDE